MRLTQFRVRGHHHQMADHPQTREMATSAASLSASSAGSPGRAASLHRFGMGGNCSLDRGHDMVGPIAAKSGRASAASSGLFDIGSCK
jgi:hypothetical protein